MALSKVCRQLQIPKPSRGYWAKKLAGRPVPRRQKLAPFPVETAGVCRRDPFCIRFIFRLLVRLLGSAHPRDSRCELRAEAEPTKDASEIIGSPAVTQCQRACDCLRIAPARQILRVAHKRVEVVLHVQFFNQGGHQVGRP